MTGLGVLNTIANRIPEKPVMALLDDSFDPTCCKAR